jgi:hypothetical protein
MQLSLVDDSPSHAVSSHSQTSKGLSLQSKQDVASNEILHCQWQHGVRPFAGWNKQLKESLNTA